MVDAFGRRKGALCTALRRDVRLTATARVVGLEYMAWWGKRNLNGPIYGLTAGKLHELLGFSERAIRNAQEQLERFSHFRFKRTGRADLAWPASVAPPSLGLGDRRSVNFTDQIGSSDEGRAVESADRKIQETKKNLLRSRRCEGDAQTEQKLREALGNDGQEILSALYSIDGGAPYRRLMTLARKPFKVVAVALANKMARIAWALLVKGGPYRARALVAAA
jgi:hypothetical protein